VVTEDALAACHGVFLLVFPAMVGHPLPTQRPLSAGDWMLR
jgi:hypothetical protein